MRVDLRAPAFGDLVFVAGGSQWRLATAHAYRDCVALRRAKVVQRGPWMGRRPICSTCEERWIKEAQRNGGQSAKRLSALLVTCSSHRVAECPRCRVRYRLIELAPGAISGLRFDRCPRCWEDLADQIIEHAERCPDFPVRAEPAESA